MLDRLYHCDPRYNKHGDIFCNKSVAISLAHGIKTWDIILERCGISIFSVLFELGILHWKPDDSPKLLATTRNKKAHPKHANLNWPSFTTLKSKHQQQWFLLLFSFHFIVGIYWHIGIIQFGSPSSTYHYTVDGKILHPLGCIKPCK